MKLKIDEKWCRECDEERLVRRMRDHSWKRRRNSGLFRKKEGGNNMGVRIDEIWCEEC